MKSCKIAIDAGRLDEICQSNHIRRLALFDSILRDDFGPDSDIDGLVEFEPGQTPGLDFFAKQDELSAIFGRGVDLNTLGFLSRYFRERVLAEAEVRYVAPR
jgi:predicted nucleotidyltransferase